MRFLYPLLVVLLAVFAIAPLEYPGAFQSHSGLLAVYNLIHLDQNPWQFYNWAPTVGRTFDLFRSEGPLPYTIAELFHLAGFGYLAAIKLVYALAWVGSGIAMYAAARRWLSHAGALLAAIVYVYLPSHIAAVYVRGAFAESVAWALLPLALGSVADGEFRVGNWRDLLAPRRLVRLVPFAALFLTQPGLAVLFALVSLAWMAAWRWGESNWVRPALYAIAGGLGLGALFAAPTILRHGANIASNGFVPNYVFPFQLFSPLWGFGASTGSYLDLFPFQLGVAPIGLAIVAGALVWRPGSEAQAAPLVTRRFIANLLGVAVVLAVLTFEIAAPVWGLLGALAAYPWALLTLAGVILALLAGSAVELDSRLSAPAMLAVLTALPVVASYGYLTPRYLDVSPTRPQIAIFGNNEIALLDYRIVGPLRHGATLRLDLQWQALRQVDHDYTVFVHAVHEDGTVSGQRDAKPQDGGLPTIKWAPGQVVSDRHTVQIDVEGPREGYHLEVGLYVAATGERAILDSGADHLVLPRPGDPEPIISEHLPLAQSE